MATTSFTHKTRTGVDVNVTGKYIAGSRGARDSLGGVRGAGPALEPDDAAEFEIYEAVTAEGEDIAPVLDDAEIEAIINAGIEQAEVNESYDEPEYDIPDERDYDYDVCDGYFSGPF